MGRLPLRAIAIAVPVVVIGGIELLADWVLDPYLVFPYDTVVVTLAVLGIATVLVVLTSRRISLLDRALATRNRELEARTTTARALHQLSVSVAGTRDLQKILDAVVESARSLLDAEVAIVVWPWRDGGGSVAARSGPAEAVLDPGAASGGEPADLLAAPYRQSVLAAPLRRAGETVGALAVAHREKRSHGVDDVETLSSLANQLALAIENVRLEGQLRELAVRGERERIAREMHDNLAQVLSYVNTKSQAVRELLASGRTDVATTQLDELAAAARSIYVDVREAILGLTTPVTPEQGLVGALHAYAERFTDAAKIATHVLVRPGVSLVELSPEAEAQVFRIVQEALTNVRKHAGAQRAVIGLDMDGAELSVSVTDDGRGFDTGGSTSSDRPWSGFGMAAMRDRAAAIGATLAVESRPGRGTVIRLTLPVDATVMTTAG
jgi:two-component system nitrate/nitrite sensor histidine kinase NarX